MHMKSKQQTDNLIKTQSQIANMREACKITILAIEKAAEAIEVGISTYDIDNVARKVILSNGGKPAFLGQYGFPATACISVNDEVVHGIPNRKRVLSLGDTISIDCGTIIGGMYSDMARTFFVGEPSAEQKCILEAAQEILDEAIKYAKPNFKTGDIGHAIAKKAAEKEFDVVKEYTGHGIGTSLHELPAVPNYGSPGTGSILLPNMTIAIEPMLTVGEAKTKVLEDGWTVSTMDGKLSVHIEDTVLITENGNEILTRN